MNCMIKRSQSLTVYNRGYRCACFLPKLRTNSSKFMAKSNCLTDNKGSTF